MDKISAFISKKPKLVVIISLILLVPSLIGYIFTDVNYDLLSYLPDGLDSVKGQQVLSETYHVDSTTMVIVENMQSKRVVELKEKIAEVENVASVLWYDDLIDTSIPFDILPDEVRNVFYSQNGNYTMMFVQFNPECSSQDVIEAVSQIKKVTQKQCLLSGLTPINADIREITNKELPIYIALAIIFVLLIMFVTMESYILPFVMMFVLGIAVILNMGTNWIIGGVSYITQCVGVILQLAVTMDYSIFVINRFEEEKLKSATKEEAMAKTLKASATSLVGSSTTTVFGFVALCFMQLSLGFNIGIVMAKGVIVGVISAVTILPAYLLVFDEKINEKKHKVFSPDFSKIIDFSIKKRKAFVIIFAVLLIPAIILSANVKKYYNITSTLPEDLDSVVALDTLKDEFNMKTTHFIVVNDSVSAEKLIEMENRINDLDGITSMLAYNQFVGSSIPDSVIPDGITDIIKQGGYQVMLVNSEFEAATEPSNEQVVEMYSILKEYDPDGFITGEGAMYSDLVDITVTDFTVTSIISILAIFVIIAILFKSYSIPIVLILSIEFAIWINESISTIFGTPISFFAPTVISCVQLGATVDYAILLTSRFKEEIRSGTNKFEAVRKAAIEAMHSVFQSAVVFFVVTIGVYLVSSISIVKELCALLARGSIISALIIIFVLTPLLIFFEKTISKTSKEWSPEATVKSVQGTASIETVQNQGFISIPSSQFNECEETENEDI
ncbi:MAG: MMPL family transporter [Acutalibacteraceae bacterium]|nr:MMPL family transporter [Acutalibacteraceae bacterium]